MKNIDLINSIVHNSNCSGGNVKWIEKRREFLRVFAIGAGGAVLGLTGGVVEDLTVPIP